MARYTDAVCRLCRRDTKKLFLKGTKCNTDKCPVSKRAFAPGQHGPSKTRIKLSNYAVQLREKQKVKHVYGVLESQFRKYFETAEKSKGVTGKVLLQLLERRLDNIIFRMGIGKSRANARQIVRHNHVSVNGVRVNIPSYIVDAGNVVAITGPDKKKAKLRENLDYTKDRTVPKWLEFNKEGLHATVIRLPEKSDIGQQIEEALIVEFYSK